MHIPICVDLMEKLQPVLNSSVNVVYIDSVVIHVGGFQALDEFGQKIMLPPITGVPSMVVIKNGSAETVNGVSAILSYFKLGPKSEPEPNKPAFLNNPGITTEAPAGGVRIQKPSAEKLADVQQREDLYNKNKNTGLLFGGV